MALTVHMRKGTGNLCDRCIHSTVIRGENSEVVYCSDIGGNIRGMVKECSGFESPGKVEPPYTMRQTAWILEVKKGQVIGFQSPEERNKKGEEII